MKILAEARKGSNEKMDGSRTKRRCSLRRGPARLIGGSATFAGTARHYNLDHHRMFILLNGSFGIGKSTVARELRAVIPGAAIFDPEPIGLVLMHLAFRRVSDFQDLARWRRWTVLGARVTAVYRSTVIIPMAFSSVAYLDEIEHGLRATGRPVRHFCLTAPLEVVQQRLAGRGEPQHDPRFAWPHRRAIECVEAHQSARFSEHVPTASRSPSEIAADIVARLTVER
jgi:predicted kinase